MRSLCAVALLVLLDVPLGARGGGVWDTKHLLNGASKEVEKKIKDKQTDQLVAKVKQVVPEEVEKTIKDTQTDQLVAKVKQVAPEEVEKTIKDTQTDELVAKVQQVAPEVASKVSHEDAEDAAAKAIEKTQEVLGPAMDSKVASKVSHEDAAAEAIEETQKVLAPAMDSKVVGAVSSAVERTTEQSGIRDVLPPEVATAINSTRIQKGIEVAKGMAPKVVKAIRKTNPQTVEEVVEAGSSPKTYEEVIETVKDVDWWSKNWTWVSLGLLSSIFMAFAVCGLCKMAKTRRQGPPLMMDGNINMYLRAEGGSTSSRTPLSSIQNGAENMFTRF